MNKIKGNSILEKIVLFLLFAGMLTAVFLVFIWMPGDRRLGNVQKIFYFHVASAWAAFLAFFIVFLMSINYLVKGNTDSDIISSVSAEIGILFATLVLITGSIWGRSSWNVWWTWEPRLTTTLILWFIYLAYLLIREAIQEHEKAARISAVYGIVGFIDVPIVFMSIRWWRSRLHPVVFGSGPGREGGGLDSGMLFTLLFSIAVFTVLFFVLLVTAYRQRKLSNEIFIIKEKLRQNL